MGERGGAITVLCVSSGDDILGARPPDLSYKEVFSDRVGTFDSYVFEKEKTDTRLE